MLSFNQPSRIIVTCSNRIAPFLEKEITRLGFQPRKTFATGVEMTGTLHDCICLNLRLRCASQVLYSLKSFSCKNADDLYYHVSQIQWESIIPQNGYFSVTGNVDNETINNSLYANVKVKDAIVDRFRSKFNQRPDSGPALDKTVLNLFWKNDQAQIFIDTSGETLSKHGYRKIPGKAPMIESLAAATLLASKWNEQSPFINPMCGSSTLAIEAALLATNRFPCLFRNNYGFMHVEGYQNEFYENEKQKLNAKIKTVPELKIIASDISSDAINISKINATAAGVEKLISFEVCDFKQTYVPENGQGVVFFNPEYGERLGDENDLQNTYTEIGNFMKQNCEGYTGYVFTGNFNLAKKIGLKPKRKIEFYNGKIDCRLLEFELYRGSKKVEK